MMYDIAIIGGGIGGLMAAYRAIVNNPELKIVILEKGLSLSKRHCPAGKNQKCMEVLERKVSEITSRGVPISVATRKY